MNVEYVPHPDSPYLLVVFIDGEEWRAIHTSLFGKRPNLPMAENLALFEEAFNRLELEKAKQYAVKCLARKQYLSHELKKKLSEVHVSESTVSKAIAHFTQLGYLNDKDWIQQFISKQSGRRYGPKAIAQKLRQKGVSGSQIPSLQTPSDETKQVRQILQTRFKSRDLSIPKEKQRAIAFLLRRGFSFSLILDSVNADEWDES